jgi:hypothetical protein
MARQWLTRLLVSLMSMEAPNSLELSVAVIGGGAKCWKQETC